MENFVSTCRDIESSAAAMAVAAVSFMLASMEATATDFE